MVHAADIQDRDGAPALLASIRSAFPWLRHVFADGGYAGPKDLVTKALARLGTWTLEIVKRSDTAKGFVLLPRRWVVERTFAWFGRNRTYPASRLGPSPRTLRPRHPETRPASRSRLDQPTRHFHNRRNESVNRNRRCLKVVDRFRFEKTIESAEAWLLIASIQLLTRRIARA